MKRILLICGVMILLCGKILVAAAPKENGIEKYEMELQQSIEFGNPTTFRGSGGSIVSLAFSPDDALLAAGLTAQAENRGDQAAELIEVWNIEQGERVAEVPGHEGTVKSLAFSSDGSQLVSACADRTIRLWSTEDWHCTATLEGHTAPVNSVDYRPGYPVLASAGDDAIRFWNSETHECDLMLDSFMSNCYTLAFTPDGNRLIAGFQDGSLRVVEMVDGEWIKHVEGAHGGYVCSAACSRDGQMFATGSFDSKVKLWETGAPEYCETLEGHTAEVNSVAFGPHSLLASAADDGTVRVWDYLTTQCIATLDCHGPNSHRGVYDVVFSHDGTKLAASTVDNDGGLIYIWDVVVEQG